MDPQAAKQFFIDRVIEEAGMTGVPMSMAENKMLSFSEVHSSSPDVYEINEQFERDYDSDDYEAKVMDLLKRARLRDLTATGVQQWQEAIQALRNEDHYILVMLYRAFPEYRETLMTTHRVRDYLIYVAIGVGVVVIAIVTATLLH